MWLLDVVAKNKLEIAYRNSSISLDERATFVASRASSQSNTSRLLTASGDTAIINVSGVLTKSPDIIAELFGGGNTTYSEINEALLSADNNDSISNITLSIDSPGGEFDGLFDTLNTIGSINKPVNAMVNGLAASAAFAIASQADTITASNIASRVGSVGVVATFNVDESLVSITSTEAPDKRPDVTTENGVATVKKELDSLHNIFVDSIAKGRNTSIENVNKSFGRGATFLADEALNRGMIDSIMQAPGVSDLDNNIRIDEGFSMDLKEFQSKHTALFEEVLSMGVSKERDRVCAHVILGNQSGDMKTACEAIESGSELTQTIQAKYNAASMNKNAVSARQEESDLEALDNISTKKESKSQSEQVLDIIYDKMNIGK